MANGNEALVLEFCEAWSRRNIDELIGYFADDAVYHNIPIAAAKGHDAIRNVLNIFVPPSEEIEFEVVNIASSGSVVHTERVDRFTIAGKKVELPVAGVFEVDNGKISAWRDYFDMATWTRQTT